MRTGWAQNGRVMRKNEQYCTAILALHCVWDDFIFSTKLLTDQLLSHESNAIEKSDTMKQKVISRHIVSDPEICHGQPTFRGTRIMVWQVLDQVAHGMAWETIVAEWQGGISKEAIAEAVNLANQAFVKHANEYVLEPISA